MRHVRRENPRVAYRAVTISIVALFLLVVLTWNMTDGSQFAHETAEMGGVPFPEPGNPEASDEDGTAASTLETRLAQISETYGLSPREVEVAMPMCEARPPPGI